LAYIVRKRLRYMGIKKGFKVVFSEELPDKESIVPCEDRNKKSQVGTISYIPAVFGCVCAQAAVQHLLAMDRLHVGAGHDVVSGGGNEGDGCHSER
jgi:tRNA A37 threonylcarbamoyladenosine dehydratase